VTETLRCPSAELPASNAVRRGQSLLTSPPAQAEAHFPPAAGNGRRACSTQLELDWPDALLKAPKPQPRRLSHQPPGCLEHDRQRGIVLVGAVPLRESRTFVAVCTAARQGQIELATTPGQPLTAVVDGYTAPLTAGALRDTGSARLSYGRCLPSAARRTSMVLPAPGFPSAPPMATSIPPVSKQRRSFPRNHGARRDQPSTTKKHSGSGIFSHPCLPFATPGNHCWAHFDEALDDGLVPVPFCSCLRRKTHLPAGLNLNRTAALRAFALCGRWLEGARGDDREPRELFKPSRAGRGPRNLRPLAEAAIRPWRPGPTSAWLERSAVCAAPGQLDDDPPCCSGTQRRCAGAQHRCLGEGPFTSVMPPSIRRIWAGAPPPQSL